MSELEEVKKKLTNRIGKIDDYLAKTAKFVEITPILQKLKEDTETSLKILNEIPEDIAIEYAPKWLRMEIENVKILDNSIPTLPAVTDFSIRALDTSGSVTPYIMDMSNSIPFQFDNSVRPIWADNVITIVSEYSGRVSQREYLPERLNKINKNLGGMFKVALASYDKCKNGILKVDQSAIQLRDVIEQVWGGLTETAKEKNKDTSRNTQNLQIRKEGDRDLVSEILSNEVFPKIKLVQLFQDMYTLHLNFSDSKFGKNPLSTDLPRLSEYYNEWLILLDGISGIVV